ncbi:MAG TPA: DNA-formamidopyrimidine glycosylase family protein [Bryobacteraceae bacterium]|nr:DNA-formamidopyrimidine glycosylase family protein [Bryobacteraceae bacterium]
MPELPDVAVYIEALRDRIFGRKLIHAQIRGPFLLRSVEPPVSSAEGQRVVDIRRLGKQIAIGFENGVWLVFHLMIAGRLHWKTAAKIGAKNLATFEFENGFLLLTEAGTQHRAAIRMARGEEGLRALSAGGLEPLDATYDQFAAVLRASNHTLKRVLTDPHLFSGIGNAYSDEILHRAQLSPIAMTFKLTDEQLARLYQATRESLIEWTNRLREEAGNKFPEGVTAFRDEMAVHGRYGKPCPRCGAKVQRIRYAANETNYCPACQTGGKLLADRGLSRLLKEDWPRTLEEMEALKQR